MDDPTFVKRFAAALRPGAYLRVIEEGDVAAGDPVDVVHRPSHDLTLAEMARLYFFDRAHIERMLVDDLPENWREWVLERRAAR
jgi:MOSC domain-containing protein YiiM